MRKTLFRRYNSGEEDIIKDIIEKLGNGAMSPRRKSEVIPVITDMMLRVKYNIDILLERLLEEGYEFKAGENAVELPSQRLDNQLFKLHRRLDEFDLHLPVTVELFYRLVGAVDFMQKEEAIEPFDFYADPFVFYPLDAIVDYVCSEIWKDEIEAAIEDNEPLTIPFSPDDYHKNYESGGMPYAFELTSSQQLNPRIIGFDQNIRFWEYLKLTFKWGGFIGYRNKYDWKDIKIQQLIRGLKRI